MLINPNKTRTFALLLILGCLLSTLFLPRVYAVEDSWATLKPMPTARAGLGVAVVNGKIYAIGGDRDGTVGWTGINEMYDPATDTWTTKTPMPSAREDFGIAVVQKKIYIIGGMGYVGGYPNIVGATEVYDTVTDTWETRTSIPTPRESLVANVVNGKIYVMAGDAYGGPPGWMVLVNKTEIYDPTTDTWATGALMPNFEGYGTAPNTASAVIDNKIYVVVYQTLHIYDPETDSWSNGSSLFAPAVAGPIACATTGVFAPKRIHVLDANTHQIYDPETGTWSNNLQMPTPRRYLGGTVINDRMYVIGGYVKSGELEWEEEATDINEVYTPSEYIPEFPSLIILPLILVTALFAVTLKKRVYSLSAT